MLFSLHAWRRLVRLTPRLAEIHIIYIIYICHAAVANLLSIFKKRLGEVAQLGAPLPRREPLRHGGWRQRLDARTSMPKLIEGKKTHAKRNLPSADIAPWYESRFAK